MSASSAVSLPSPGGLALLTGTRPVYALAHNWMCHLAVAGRAVHVIDCAIRFNVYAVAEQTLRAGINPDLILRRIHIRRAFTPYQILETLRDVFSQGRSEKAFLLLAPFKQFFDGDVAVEEARFLLNKAVHRLKAIRDRRIPLLVVERDNYDHPAFPSAYQGLKKIAQPVWEVTDEAPSHLPPIFSAATEISRESPERLPVSASYR